MIGTIEGLSLAVACFVGGHFILSSVNVRKHAAALLGDTGFRALYSLMAIMSMVWTVMAYKAAPDIELWQAGMALTHVPVVVMPFACFLFVAGLTGCTLYVSPDLLLPVPVIAGSTSFTWTIAPDISLLGLEFFNQGISVDPGSNPIGLVLSNAATGVVSS